MTLAKDFEDFFRLLNKYELEYLVIQNKKVTGRPSDFVDIIEISKKK